MLGKRYSLGSSAGGNSPVYSGRYDELNPTSASALDSFTPLEDIGHWTS